MAIGNPQVSSGDGLASGSNASANAVTVTGAYDFLFQRQNNDGYIGGSTTGITLTAAGAGTVNGADSYNKYAQGMNLLINITAITGSLTVSVQGKDPASGTYYTILTSAALAATGATLLTIHPSFATTANLSANASVPLTFRIVYTVATGPVTATIGAAMII